ncbi:hypothetical protein [Neptunicella sp.]|uniref:hypothetical protein n=1 Tax=Neptunicella sp. TaxID=2125986 RepID=UPI003F68D057
MLPMYTASCFGAWNKRIIRNRYILFSLFFFLFPSWLNAAPADKTLTLANAIQRSLSQNPSLKVFPFRYAALKGQAQTAQLRPAFELGFDASNIGGTGNFTGIGGSELTVALSSVIEMGGKRSARQDLISYSRSVIDANRQVESLALLGEVTRRYRGFVPISAKSPMFV